MKVKPQKNNIPKGMANVTVQDAILSNLFSEHRKSGEIALVFRGQHEGTRHVITIGHASYMSLQEARKECLLILEALKDGKNPKAVTLTFEKGVELADEWTEKHGTKSQLADLKKQKSRLRVLSPLFLAKKMGLISESDLRQELESYKKTGVSDATVNRLLSAISRIYRIVNSLGYEIPNKCLKIKRRAENNIRTNTLPAEAIKYYIQQLLKDSNWLAAYALIIMVSTGIRCGNVISMTVDMVSSCLGYIRLPMTKSGKPQTVSVPKQLRPYLQELLDNARRKNSHFLFPSDTSSTGHIASPRGTHERAIAALNAMGFNVDCTIHDLRRTFANQLLRASGGNVYLVSQALGHGSVAVTMRYLSIRSDELDNAVNLAGAALGLESLAA